MILLEVKLGQEFHLFEGGTGAAFSDEDGVTVNIVCNQYELPNPYIPAATGLGVVLGASGLTATTT